MDMWWWQKELGCRKEMAICMIGVADLIIRENGYKLVEDHPFMVEQIWAERQDLANPAQGGEKS